MYLDNEVVPTTLSNWELFTQPIRDHQLNCGNNVTVGYPDSVVPFGNSSVINPWLGGMYVTLLLILFIAIPLVSYVKKLKRRIALTYVSVLSGLFILSSIFANSPYGHLDNPAAWTIFIIDWFFIAVSLAAFVYWFAKNVQFDK